MSTLRIRAILERTEGPTVLDLGAVQHDASKAASDRWLHEHLVQRFERVIGVDILAEDIQRLNRQGYEMVQADVEAMTLGVEADTVVAGELIEHLSNPGAMLDCAYEHLNVGGRLVLSTPNPWAFVHLRRWLSDSLQVNDEHTAWFGPTVLAQLLERHGFTDVRVAGTAPERPWWSLTALLERLEVEPFGYTTWIVSARKPGETAE